MSKETTTVRARLLIVDDEAAQMKALCRTLGDEGFATTGFTSAQEALAALRQGQFDLLLTDLMMPGMDGVQLLRAARGVDPDLSGVVMTGHGTIETALGAMKGGAIDYILKPFNLSAILPVLDRAMEVRRLRKQNAELEQSVRARSAELETANRELEAFAHSVSHDLRAPLRSTSAIVHFLKDDHGPELSADANKLLERLDASVTRMAQLIEDLLRFARVVRQPISMHPVSVGTLVAEIVNELQAEPGQRHIDLRIGGLPDCIGDRPLLKQVFANLLSNAFKYTRKKPVPVVEISGRKEAGEVIYTVGDNGAGFDMKYADKLFGVFQRLHGSEGFEGTGIGLSLVQRIVQRHGGRIWAEAEVDCGATFCFTLPDR